MAADTYSGLPRDKELAIQSYGNWILFVTFTFPDPIDPVRVRMAGEYLRKWFRSQGISYVCAFELGNRHEDTADGWLEHYNFDLAQETLHRPHYHVIIDRYLDQQQLNRMWYQALHAPAKVDIQRVEAGTMEKLYSYVQKQQKPSILRRAKSIYDISYTLLVDGHLFSLWLNHVRCVLALRDSSMDLDSYPSLRRYREAQLVLERKTLDLIEVKESVIDDEFHNTVHTLVNHGKEQFFPAFEQYLQLDRRQHYHRHPLAEPLRTHLVCLGSTLVLKVLVFKLLRSFKNSPLLVDFTEDLYEAIIRLGKSAPSSLGEALGNEALACVHHHMLGLYGLLVKVYGSIFAFDDSDGHLRYTIREGPFAAALATLERQAAFFGQFPMIYMPKPWLSTELNPHRNCTGGFLSNGVSLALPLSSTRESNIISILDENTLFKINAKQSCAYTINKSFFDAYVQSKLWISDEEYNRSKTYARKIRKANDGNIPKGIVTKRLAKADETISQWQSQRLIEKSVNSLLVATRECLGDPSLDYETLFLYVVAMVDGRLRSYQRSWLSVSTSKLCRYMIQAPIAEPFDLNVFKFYATKTFLGSVDRRNETQSIAYFDQVLHIRMVSFRTNHCYLETKESEAFLACCVEYERFNDHLSRFADREEGLQVYRSRFFAYRDQTNSSNQLLALIFRCGSWAKPLNMTFDDQPFNFSLEFFRDYKNKFIMHFDEYRRRWDSYKLDAPKTYKNLDLPMVDLDRDPEGAVFNRQKHVFLKPFKALVMTLPYNKRESRFAEETIEYFGSIGFLQEVSNRHEIYKFLVDTIWEFAQTSTIGVYLKFLHRIARAFTRRKMPPSVRTPLKTRMIMVYRRIKLQPIRHLLPDARGNGTRKKDMMVAIPVTPIDSARIGNAFMANFIHACDGSLVLGLGGYMGENHPFVSYATIHDCYGTTTNRMNSMSDVVCDIAARLFCDEDYLMLVIQDCARQLELAPIPNAPRVADKFRKTMVAELVNIRQSFEKPLDIAEFRRRPPHFTF